jgi:hypothetical protein
VRAAIEDVVDAAGSLLEVDGLFEQPTMCGGSEPTERSSSTRSAVAGRKDENRAVERNQRHAQSGPRRSECGSICGKRADRFEHIRGPRQDRFLEHRRIAPPGNRARHSLDRRVEMLEELVGDPRGDLRAEPHVS